MECLEQVASALFDRWRRMNDLMRSGCRVRLLRRPDVQQQVIRVVPGSVFANVVWLLVSLGFKWYVSAFATYQKAYGVIVALLWLYVSGLAILMGAEMNAVIEHASPMGKDPG
jgi:membrane protein